ncbi:MAG: FAD-binding oxidoreductase [Thermoanaerobaculia bacterium]|nr:FAD-binding oxidoreductase [Thermoanaerobaculia bacterium]
MSELPQPFWFHRSSLPREGDVIVVGAGIVGLSTAYWAARSGLDVLVLEADRIGLGATGRSTGFLQTGGVVPFTVLVERVGEEAALAWWELSRENSALLREEILEEGGSKVEWRPEGSWRTGRRASSQETAWEASVERLRGEGFPVRWRDREEVEEVSGSDLLGGALFVEEDGGLDPLSLCRAFSRVDGVRVLRGARIRELEESGSGVVVRWAGGEARAARLILAVNAQIVPLVPILARIIRPWSLQALATEPAKDRLPGLWVVNGEDLTLRQLADGTLLAAGGGPPAHGGESGFLELPTASGQGALESCLESLFPHLETAVAYRWAGTVARTRGGMPLVGVHPELARVAYASGFGGQGLALGFALGRRLGRWLAGGELELPEGFPRPELPEAAEA